MVQFGNKFPKDDTLKSILEREADGILRWAVEGMKSWREHGLMEPEQVLKATTDYRADEDTLQRFINDECEVGKRYESPARKLYEAYKDWAKNNHEVEMSERKFADGMKDRGYAKDNRNTGRVYVGIRKMSTFEEHSMADIVSIEEIM